MLTPCLICSWIQFYCNVWKRNSDLISILTINENDYQFDIILSPKQVHGEPMGCINANIGLLFLDDFWSIIDSIWPQCAVQHGGGKASTTILTRYRTKNLKSFIQGLVFKGKLKGQESKSWDFFEGPRRFRGPQKSTKLNFSKRTKTSVDHKFKSFAINRPPISV